MGEPTDYATRLRTAKQLAGVADDKTLAKNVGISLQAINKIWAGTSKALSAANNVRAARYLAVDSEWLALGEGVPRSDRVWPLSEELLAACRAASHDVLRKAENAARNVLDLEPLTARPVDLSIGAASREVPKGGTKPLQVTSPVPAAAPDRLRVAPGKPTAKAPAAEGPEFLLFHLRSSRLLH